MEAAGSLRDSGDSSDSLPTDFPVDPADPPPSFSGALEKELRRQQQSAAGGGGVAGPGGGPGETDLDRTLTEDDIASDGFPRETSTIKRKSRSRGASEESVGEERGGAPESNGDLGPGRDARGKHVTDANGGATEHEHAQCRTDGVHCSGDGASVSRDKIVSGGGGDFGHAAANTNASNRQSEGSGCNSDVDALDNVRRTNSTASKAGEHPAHASVNSTVKHPPSIDLQQQPQTFPTMAQQQQLQQQQQAAAVRKRNSLEVRNNIPNVNQIKTYDHESDSIAELNRISASQGAVPKMKKKSPGMARRLNDGAINSVNTTRDTSSSEKETDPLGDLDNSVISAQKMFEQQLQAQLRTGGHPSAGVLAALNRSLPQATTPTAAPLDSYFLRSDANTSPGKDVENEYDYVKYARIQSGDSYVGMRLAYSTSNDSLNVRNKGMLNSADDQHLGGSSREASPEKHHNHGGITYDQIRANSNRVAEDTLTEIPLNGSDVIVEERKEFSLSPEATECDSAEVESVISDEGNGRSRADFRVRRNGLLLERCRQLWQL